MIQAVIYDFGNVLCSFRVTSFFEHLARRSTCTVDQLQGLMPEISHLAIEYESGRMTSQQFFRDFSTLARISVTEEEFIKSYTTIFTQIGGTVRASPGQAVVRPALPAGRVGAAGVDEVRTVLDHHVAQTR